MNTRERIERMQRDAEKLRDLIRGNGYTSELLWAGELGPTPEELRSELQRELDALGKLAFTVSEAIHALRSE